MGEPALSLQIATTVHHRIHTVTVRMDSVGWVVSGTKHLVTPGGGHRYPRGRVFVLPRGAQWEVVNDPAPQGRYVARLLCFAPELVEQFHRLFGQFAAVPPVQGCAGLAADATFEDSFTRAVAALESDASSQALREHRALEVLLMLAEAGIVFAPPGELGWAERVRRLAQEGETVSQCLRDVRLETALVLLQSSTLQVSEIAARCGYESHSRFSAAFRERFGFPPSQLRP
ncbi:MAG: AraC family transcriptional regulator [Acidovorax sp. SCN 65-108]|nr:MAG: AraC family transcriptional regulator [Acidovorax sp. SCN 65-108]OJV73946.1 MAG: AraC family transcriptional regulator [Burkholderiales bacterium 64-34]